MKFALSTILILASNFLFSQAGVISIQEEVYYQNDTIKGTLVTPFNKDITAIIDAPLVLIIPGSGPTDRDGNSQLSPTNADVFLHLADSLAKMGISSFRFDKIGVGKSTFNVKESDFRFEDNVEVVLKIIAMLKTKVGIKNIFIMGHSEGSLIGMLTCQKATVNGYISLAGPAKNACDILKDQMRANLTGPIQAQAIVKLDSLGKGFKVKKFNIMLASLMRASLQPYIISWFEYTPSQELAKLKCPVLIIQGGRDIQVPQAEGEMLASIKGDYLLYPKMNHVTKDVGESRDENLAAYSDPDFPFSENFIVDLATWIKAGGKLE